MDNMDISCDGFALIELEQCDGLIVIYYKDASTVSL
jgi:hypothetical protein